jgi:peptide/nickel transport system permease protein
VRRAFPHDLERVGEPDGRRRLGAGRGRDRRPIGLLASFADGWADAVLSRIADAMLSVPFLILAIALATFLGPALENAMFAIAITFSPIFVHPARGMTLDAKSTDWVEARCGIGTRPGASRRCTCCPTSFRRCSSSPPSEAALSFLGLGQQPPAPSWGSMLNSAQRFLENAPWLAVFPGAAIFLVVLAFNLVGDGLRDALDPRAERRQSRFLMGVNNRGWRCSCGARLS